MKLSVQQNNKFITRFEMLTMSTFLYSVWDNWKVRAME